MWDDVSMFIAALVSCVASALLITTIALSASDYTSSDDLHEFKQQAVERGCGEWINEDGEKHFKWRKKDSEQNVKRYRVKVFLFPVNIRDGKENRKFDYTTPTQ